MPALAPNAHRDPVGYLDHLYLKLPRLVAHGGTQDAVHALFGDLDVALGRALGAEAGSTVAIRLFARPWGWAPEALPSAPAVVATAVPDARDCDLASPGLHGLVFVETAPGAWQRWRPTSGPAPVPDGSPLRLVVVLRRDGQPGVTACLLREVYGLDCTLRAPLYKSAVRFSPASANEASHLIHTLRGLLAAREAA